MTSDAPLQRRRGATENGKPALKDDLCSPAKIDPTNKPKPAKPQAPDNSGESDLDFFSRRPGVNGWKRLAFDNEPPPGLLERDDNVAFISVRLERDAAGKAATILREIAYGQWGHA